MGGEEGGGVGERRGDVWKNEKVEEGEILYKGTR